MKTKLIDGKLISSDIRLEITEDVSKLKNEYNIAPKLCVILIGDDPASHVYVRNKQKSAISAGRSKSARTYNMTTPPACNYYQIVFILQA